VLARYLAAVGATTAPSLATKIRNAACFKAKRPSAPPPGAPERGAHIGGARTRL
jgi:hypothetical protein